MEFNLPLLHDIFAQFYISLTCPGTCTDGLSTYLTVNHKSRSCDSTFKIYLQIQDGHIR